MYVIGGLLVGVLLGSATAIMDAVLTPTFIGSIRSPLAPLLALIGNAGLVWFVYTVTRRVGLSLLPGVAWFITLFIAGTKTSEGDLIVISTWVSLLTLLLGSIGWAGAGYIVVLRRPVTPQGAQPNRIAAKPGKVGPSATNATGSGVERRRSPN